MSDEMRMWVVCSGCGYSDKDINLDSGDWTCWRCGAEGETDPEDLVRLRGQAEGAPSAFKTFPSLVPIKEPAGIPTPEITPQDLEPGETFLVDEHYPDGTSKQWFVVEGGEFEYAGHATVGTTPEWISWVIEEASIDGLLEDLCPEPSDKFLSRANRFLIENGIAPGQPFLVELRNFSNERSYWGDYDAEWDVDLIRVDPWSQEKIRSAWEDELNSLQEADIAKRYREEQRRAMALRVRDPAKMAIYVSRYFHKVSSRDDMNLPDGVSASLTVFFDGQDSMHIAEGRSDKGDLNEALRDLVCNAAGQGFFTTFDDLKRVRKFR